MKSHARQRVQSLLRPAARPILKTIPVVLLAIQAMTGCSPTAPLPSEPHPVIIIDIDTLRADHLGAYGYDRETSPNLDAFAQESVLFEWAFSQAPNTPPSQTSILTGLYPGTHGMVYDEDKVPESAVTIAEALAAHGFQTAGFHDGGYLSNTFNIGQGFELYDNNKGQGLEAIGPKVFDWLRANHQNDFFLFVHTYDTHTPYAPGPPYDTMFMDGVPAPSEGFEPTPEQMEKVRLSKYTDTPMKLPDNDLAYAMALYDGEIRKVDTWFGELMQLIRSLGLHERATIIVISDHGEEFQEHGSVLHEKLYATVTRVPLIIRLPGATHTGRIEPVVETVDLMPTILELTGAPIPPAVQGRSLLPLIRGDTDAENETHVAFGESPFFGHRRHVTVGDLRLIYTQKNGAVELYRYRSDRAEQEDVSDRHTDEVANLLETLKSWETSVRIPLAETDGESGELDPETLEQLRELGYIQ